ncbi:septum formation family protein [Nonomuraea insulae]|uniref:Septum formation family protein n=1 Tax=Nonomuraea insulae TaxID=1616787 RepID=A0ABW1DBX7_9ACTN
MSVDVSDQAIDLGRAVTSRKRVIRGILPVRLLMAYLAATAVSVISTPFSGHGPLVYVIVAVAVAVIAAVAAAVWAGRELRRGGVLAARVTLAAAVLALLVFLLSGFGIALPGEGGEFTAGFMIGIGELAVTSLDNPFGAGPSPAVSLLNTFLLVTAFNASGLGQAMREVRWLRLLRWPILVVVAIVASSTISSVVSTLVKNGVPIEVIGAIVVLPVVALSGRAAAEVVFPASGDDLPPGWAPSTAPPRRRLFTGRHVLVVLPLWLLALAAGLIVLLAEMNKNSSYMIPGATARVASLSGAVLVLQVVVSLIGLQAYTLGRRHAALRAVDQRERDARPWLLYLRSFRDDKLRVYTHMSPRHSLLERLLAFRRERFELMLTWHLWRFGPVVAVGRPGERLAQLGAAREYLPAGTWQAEIEDRILNASAIVVVLGRTEGLAWELRTIERLAAADKMMIVVPPLREAELERRWDAFNEIGGSAGWPPVPAAARRHALVVTLSRAESVTLSRAESATLSRTEPITPGDWRVLLGKWRDEWHYEVAIDAALGRRAIRAPAPSRRRDRWRGRAAWITVLSCALVLAGVAGGSRRILEGHELAPGMCLSVPSEEVTRDQPQLALRYEVRPCGSEHGYEVVSHHVVTFDAFPGQAAVDAGADRLCAAAFQTYIGIPHQQSGLDLRYLTPTRESWLVGDEDIVCLVRDPAGPNTVPLQGSRR